MGMWDIVMRMLLCLLLAFLLGLVLGWLLKKLFGKDNCEECENRLRDLERELETSKSSLVKLRGEGENYTTRVSELETSLSKAKADLEARDADISSWEEKYLVIEKDSNERAAKLADFEANTNVSADAEAKLKSLEDDNRRLTSKISDLSMVIDRSSGKDSVKDTEIASLKAQIAKLEADLEDSNLKIAGASAAGAIGGAAITSAISNDDESDESNVSAARVPLVSSTETDFSEWDSDYEAIRLKMDELEYQATDDEEDTEEEINGWITETGDLQGRIRSLRTDAGETDESRNSRIAGLETTSVSLLRILEKAKADKLAGIAKIRRKGYELGVRDDLKLIVGVGPVLEKLLNNNDVWTFKQIAQWSDADVAEMSEKLEGFQDRIEREDWVGQSKQIHAEIYDETL